MTYKELYKKHGEIKIKCEAKDMLPLDAIMDFQGGLKKRSKQNKIKLATQIFKNGFIAPFFIWQNKGDYVCLDGHSRSEVLCEIRKAGIPIPGMFPVAYIQAKNEAAAKEILLSISSQYGDWNEDELNEWLGSMDDDIKESLRFLDEEIILNNFEPTDETEQGKLDELEMTKCPECGHEFKA